MSLRAKSKRRLLMVLTLSVASAAVLGGAYGIRRAALRSHALHAKDLGYAAAKAHDYDTALPLLGQYVARFPNDTDALYYYCLSRENVEEPNGRNLMEAISLWRHLLDLAPENLDARHQLLDLYVRVGFKTETLDGADAILTRVHDDPEALRAKAIAQGRLRKFDEALATIEHCNQLHPDNLDNQLLALDLKSSRGDTPADVVQGAAALQKAHPADPRFNLLLSIAQVRAGNQEAAAAAARAAAAQPAPDLETLTRVVHQLDALSLFSDALSSAKNADAHHPADITYRRLLANRLLLAGDYGQLATLLKDVDIRTPNADPELLALSGLSLVFQNKPQDAAPFLDAVLQRKNADALPKALATAARAIAINTTDTTEASAAVGTCQKALSADPTSPFLQYFLGQAYARQGEGELAMRSWQAAFRNAPEWAAPLTTSARGMLNSGQVQQAYGVARAAQLRAPNDEQALLTLASAWSPLVDVRQPQQVSQFLDFLQKTEAQFPAAEQLRPMHVNLLARLNRREDALRAAREALALSPTPSENTLLQLATVSQLHQLGVESDCFALSEKSHGMTPALAYAKALSLSQNEGLAFLQSVLPKQNPSADWQLAHARYLDRIHDAAAQKVWTDLAKAFPDNIQVQWAVLDTPALQSDHAFLGQVIERIRAKVGDQDIRGRLARARWLLQGTPSEKDTSEASVLLSDITHSDPNLIEPRLLLAHCMQQLGNTTGAVDQLRSAAQSRPDSNPIALELARLLIAQGETDNARAQLDRVLKNGANPAEQQQAATLYAGIGDFDHATSLLKGDTSTLRGGLLLASLYIRQNELAKAEDVCKKMMQTPTPESIQLYANLLASQGRKAEADAILAKLDSITAPPGRRELARAGYLARFGTVDQAKEQYLAATRLNPKDATAWRQLLVLLLNANKINEVAAIAPDAAKAVPDDDAFAALHRQLSLLPTLATDPDGRSLFAALIQMPRDPAGITEGLQLLSDIKTKKLHPDQFLPKLRQIADHNPQVLSLQSFAVHYLVGAGQFDDAITIATRAQQAFPDSAEATQLASASLAAAGRWNEALAAAEQWRSHLGSATLPADILIADADMQLGKVDTGLQQLQPYLERAKKFPDENPAVLMLYTQGLVATKKISQAAELFEPLLKSPSWRAEYIRLAIRLPEEKDAATWLEHAATSIPPTASQEKVQLAVAYQELAGKTNNPAYQQSALALLEPLAARPDCDPQTLMILGSLYETQKNLPAAEKTYRRSLQAKPDQPIALNNLAMVIVHEHGNLSEAVEYAAKAIKLAPTIPNFYDTQATVLAAEKSYDRAITSIAEAIKLAPTDPEWQATRIWLLALSGQQKTATSEFQQLQTTQSLAKLSPDSRQRLSTVGLQ